jgi:thiol-disulfide isomerase/thioredoxin
MSSRFASRASVTLAGLMALVGCTPHLKSDGPLELTEYELPSNTWPVGEYPPSELTEEGFRIGQTARDIRATDQFGDEVSLWQFYGMVIALDVSTIWCAPCRLLATEVDEVQEHFGEDDFIYLTLLPQNDAGEIPTTEDLVGWGEDWGVSGPILSDIDGFSYEVVPEGEAYPAIVVIGRDMVVDVDKVTPAEDSAIRAAIEASLDD